MFTSGVRCSLFAGLVAAFALLASGCGGSKSPSAATSTTSGNPTQLLDEWAACMRGHGDPNQTDPTIDAHKAIHIAITPDGGRSFFSSFKKACQPYLRNAMTALRGGQSLAKPDTAKLLAFSECMRAHGVLDFPDPSRNGLVLNGAGDLNPNNPSFHDASVACAKKTGVQAFGGTPQPGALFVTP